jgi:predicted NBD/HSP70 family sugar kinase
VVSDGSKRPRDVAVVGRGIQPGHVRQTNQRAILSVISLQPGISNAELARVTDLAPQTVSAVLADLEQIELVTRGEVLRGRRGQPATPLYMNPVGAFTIGAEIGWKRLEVCLVGIGTQVLSRFRRDYDYPDAKTVFAELAEAASDLVAALSPSERKRLQGVGLAAPGGIGSPASLLAPPPGQVEAWAGVDLGAATAAATGMKVSRFNDGHAACWAERVAHPPPRPLGFAFLLLDTFVGAGIVAENRLWEGVNGNTAALGSMLVADSEGRARFVHEVASMYALSLRLAAGGFGLEDIRAKKVPAGAAAILDTWVDDATDALAQALINTTRVMEFEVCIIESELPPAITTRVVEATRARISKFPTLGQIAPPPVIAGHLGHSGAAQGAALLHMHRRFFSRDFAHMDV